MSEKKDRWLRKLAGYKAQEDPIRDRKYAVILCRKRAYYTKKGPVFVKAGQAVANKGYRLRYRAVKKLYKRGLI